MFFWGVSIKKCNICNVCEIESWIYHIYRGGDPYHRLEVSIESKRGMMCVCARARSIKSAIEFVCAHVKDIEWLAYWNVRRDMCSLSLWHGYLPTALDYRCVVWGGGRPN